MSARVTQNILRVIIAVLALGDGVIHLFLNQVLFGGRGGPFRGGTGGGGPAPGALPGGGAGGPPPGAPLGGGPGGGFSFLFFQFNRGGFAADIGGSRITLPLSQLFLLNFIGAAVLVLVFLLSRRLLGERRWLVDLAMIGYAAVTFIAWFIVGAPNPMGLGYLSKGVEIVLIIALLADIWNIFRERSVPSPARTRTETTPASAV